MVKLYSRSSGRHATLRALHAHALAYVAVGSVGGGGGGGGRGRGEVGCNGGNNEYDGWEKEKTPLTVLDFFGNLHSKPDSQFNRGKRQAISNYIRSTR